jgi:hypothetical protein
MNKREQVASSCLFLLHDFSTLKMEATHFSETSVHTRYTLSHIPEVGILHKYIFKLMKTTLGILKFTPLNGPALLIVVKIMVDEEQY